MRIAGLDYRLPPERVAQEPSPRRDGSRLMVLDRRTERVIDTTFDAIGEHLRPGDLLVLNDTRVIPARLRARKPTGGMVELLLVARDGGDPEGRTWIGLASTSRGLRPGSRLRVAPGFEAEFLGEAGGGRVRLRLHDRDGDPGGALRRHGSIPLPPYIRRDEGDAREAIDRERYQTVYAREDGAIAAPTAGVPFTGRPLSPLPGRGL